MPSSAQPLTEAQQRTAYRLDPLRYETAEENDAEGLPGCTALWDMRNDYALDGGVALHYPDHPKRCEAWSLMAMDSSFAL